MGHAVGGARSGGWAGREAGAAADSTSLETGPPRADAAEGGGQVVERGRETARKGGLDAQDREGGLGWFARRRRHVRPCGAVRLAQCVARLLACAMREGWEGERCGRLAPWVSCVCHEHT